MARKPASNGHKTEKQAAANRENAKRPRVKGEERRTLNEAKAWVREQALSVGLVLVGHMILDYHATMQEVRAGKRKAPSKAERLEFQWAMEFLAPRCGLPAKTESDVAVNGQPIVVLRPGFTKPSAEDSSTQTAGAAPVAEVG